MSKILNDTEARFYSNILEFMLIKIVENMSEMAIFVRKICNYWLQSGS